MNYAFGVLVACCIALCIFMMREIAASWGAPELIRAVRVLGCLWAIAAACCILQGVFLRFVLPLHPALSHYRLALVYAAMGFVGAGGIALWVMVLWELRRKRPEKGK